MSNSFSDRVGIFILLVINCSSSSILFFCSDAVNVDMSDRELFRFWWPGFVSMPCVVNRVCLFLYEPSCDHWEFVMSRGDISCPVLVLCGLGGVVGWAGIVGWGRV